MLLGQRLLVGVALVALREVELEAGDVVGLVAGRVVPDVPRISTASSDSFATWFRIVRVVADQQ